MHDVTQVSQTTSHQSAHMITKHETFHRSLQQKKQKLPATFIRQMVDLPDFKTVLPLQATICLPHRFSESQV